MSKISTKITPQGQIPSYKSVLQEAGLSPKEADVYEALLEHGESGVKELLKLTSYKRGDLYNILYDLENKGIIRQTKKRAVVHFEPRDPYAIKDYIEDQKKRLYDASNLVSTLLPQMLSDFTLNISKPSVRSYEGLQGLEKIYDELNHSGSKELLLFRSVNDDDSAEYEKLVNQQIKKQIKLKIKTRALTPLVKDSQRIYLGLDQKRLVERRLVQKEKFSLPAEIMVWQNTVAIVSLKTGLIGTVIENKDIAQTFKVLFESIWGSATEYHDEIIKTWRDVPPISNLNHDKLK